MFDFLQSRRIRLLWTALIYIGASERPVSVKELAAKLDCSRRYLEADLQALAQKGVLESRRGAHGGYLLARSPHRIHLYEVLSCLDGGRESSDTDGEVSCLLQERIVAPQLETAREAVAESLARITLADALEQAASAQLIQWRNFPDFII